MGKDKKALLQESLAVATQTAAMKPSDLASVVTDTTVQRQLILLNQVRERRCVRSARA